MNYACNSAVIVVPERCGREDTKVLMRVLLWGVNDWLSCQTSGEALEQAELARSGDRFSPPVDLQLVEDNAVVSFDCIQGQE